MTQTITAEELFRAAYENRYTWDSNFPGYTAKVTVQSEGQEYTANIEIRPDLSFEVSGIEEPEIKKAIQQQLWEMTIHRVKHSFEETHGKNTFSFGKTDENGAVEILVGGASAGNSYKVKDNTVCFVNRRIRDKVVNINTLQTLQTEQGYLSEKYESFYIDPATGKAITPVTTFEDKFVKVGDYYVLAERLISTPQEGKVKTTRFIFSDIKLNSPDKN